MHSDAVHSDIITQLVRTIVISASMAQKEKRKFYYYSIAPSAEMAVRTERGHAQISFNSQKLLTWDDHNRQKKSNGTDSYLSTYVRPTE